MEIGHKIRNLRKAHGYSQEQLAEKLAVSRQTISSWENEKSFPDLHALLALQSVFHTSIDDLLREDVEEMNHHPQKATQQIQRQKDRQVLSRLTALRLITGALGCFLIFPIAIYADLSYLWLPIFGILSAVILTIPIERLRKKYDLATYKEVVAFWDEQYKK